MNVRKFNYLVYIIAVLTEVSCSNRKPMQTESAIGENASKMEYLDTITVPQLRTYSGAFANGELITYFGIPAIISGQLKSCEPEDLLDENYEYPFAVYILDATKDPEPVLVPKISGVSYLNNCLPPTSEGSMWYGNFYRTMAFLDSNKELHSYSLEGNTRGAFLIKLNADGYVEWSIFCTSDENYFIVNCHQPSMTEPFYISIGLTDSLNIYASNDSVSVLKSNTNESCFKISPDGKILSQQIFPGEETLNIQDVILLQDRVFSCGFTSVTYYDSISQVYRDFTSMFVMCTDEMGNLIWQKRFNPEFGSSFDGLVVLPDGSILAQGVFESSFPIELNTGETITLPKPEHEKSYLLMKFNRDGDIISVNNFEAAWYDYIYKTECDRYGNIHITGCMNREILCQNQSDTIRLKSKGGEDIFYLKFNSELELMKYYSFGSTGNDGFGGSYVRTDGIHLAYLTPSPEWDNYFLNNIEFPLNVYTSVLVKY